VAADVVELVHAVELQRNSQAGLAVLCLHMCTQPNMSSFAVKATPCQCTNCPAADPVRAGVLLCSHVDGSSLGRTLQIVDA
jgi:hypothetical protein